MSYKKLRVIISGGGTGGHIFPAISIAGKLREANPETEILFVGAEGKMEMEKVPAAGYKIVGLPMAGLQRQLNWGNFKNNVRVPFKVASSLRKAGHVIDEFKPDVAIGVGGYASAPLLWQATRKHIPALIQEQNGFAGLTNKILGRRVQSICVAYDGMEKFFPAEKIVFSGNPIRPEIHPYSAEDRAEGIRFYGLDPDKRHLFVVGGSLGAGTLNRAMRAWIEAGCPGGDDVEVLWQCGRYYKKGVDEFMAGRDLPQIHYTDFIRVHGRARQPRRRLLGVRDLRRAQGRRLRALPKRGRRPPDAQRDGARAQGRRADRARRRGGGAAAPHRPGPHPRPGAHRRDRGQRRAARPPGRGADHRRRSI